MKLNRNIRRILFFTLIFLALNEGVKLYFFKVSVRNHKLMQQQRLFNKFEGPIDYLFLGHSRPVRAIDTAIIQRSYVFCSGSESNVESYYKLKHLLETQPNRLKSIILPIGMTSVSLRKPNININSFYWSTYFDYLELARLSGNYSTYLSIYLKSKVCPYYEYPYIKTLLVNDELMVGMKDSVYKIASDQERSRAAYDIVANQGRFATINDSVAILYIQKTIDLAKKYDKQLIYVKYPITRYYADAVKKYDNQRIIEQHAIDSMILSQSPSVHLIDFQNEFLAQPENFRDVHHLNVIGRAALSLLLKNELNKLKQN